MGFAGGRHSGGDRQVHDPSGWYDQGHDRRTIERRSGARHPRAARGGEHATTAATSGWLQQLKSDDASHVRIQTMTPNNHTSRSVLGLAVALGVAASLALLSTPHLDAQQPQQPSDLSTTISGDPGQQPRFAVPDFIALSNDAET